MTEIAQELMTPREAARWFRRSPAWLRQQPGLLRVAGPGGQPLYHIAACRAYVLARMCNAAAQELRRVQIDALQAAIGIRLELTPDGHLAAPGNAGVSAAPLAQSSPPTP